MQYLNIIVNSELIGLRFLLWLLTARAGKEISMPPVIGKEKLNRYNLFVYAIGFSMKQTASNRAVCFLLYKYSEYCYFVCYM